MFEGQNSSHCGKFLQNIVSYFLHDVNPVHIMM